MCIRRVAAVIVAAGSGTRLGANKPKALVELGGRCLLDRALAGVRAAGVDHVVVTVSADMRDDAAVVALGSQPGVCVIEGGAERADSAWRGVQHAYELLGCPGEGEATIVVHDAARCLTPPAMIERVIHAVAAGACGVIPALPVVDTIKIVDGGEQVVGAPQRSMLRAAQTPQGFDAATLVRANRQWQQSQGAGDAAVVTDDASLLELIGVPVQVVEGAAEALKITNPIDMVVAEFYLSRG